MKIVLGLDGGGTRTRAALVSEMGEILGVGHAGPINAKAMGLEAIRSTIAEAAVKAWKDSDRKQREADAVFLGLAGVRVQSEREVFRQMAAALNLAPLSLIQVDHDLRIALAGALAGRPGVVLVAGTGSACYGRTTAGRSWKAGGWGWLIDDPGSAYWLGLQALMAVARAADGRSLPNTLTDSIQEALQLKTMDELPGRLHGEAALSRQEIAALAPRLIALAEAGDATAFTIFENGCRELVLMVTAVTCKLGLASTPIDIAVTGGISRSGTLFLETLGEMVCHSLPQAKVVKAKLPPVVGACLLTLESIGHLCTDRLIATLKDQTAARRLL